ncbi:MAG: hypothetical protein JXR64_05935 [Spirochaetales bacterium]|nr:hypothetical protein [Spirochaetales bacterium]
MRNKKRKVVKFYKSFALQLYGYLALIPFFFAGLVLLKKHNTIDLILYGTTLLILFLILLLNHFEPVVFIGEEKIHFPNRFSSKPVVESRKNITSIKKINRNTILITFEKREYKLKLSTKATTNIIKILEDYI